MKALLFAIFLVFAQIASADLFNGEKLILKGSPVFGTLYTRYYYDYVIELNAENGSVEAFTAKLNQGVCGVDLIQSSAKDFAALLVFEFPNKNVTAVTIEEVKLLSTDDSVIYQGNRHCIVLK